MRIDYNMLLREMLKKGIDKLKSCKIENGEQDARLIAMHVLKLDYTGLFMKLDNEVDTDTETVYNRLIEKKSYPLSMPVYYRYNRVYGLYVSCGT